MAGLHREGMTTAPTMVFDIVQGLNSATGPSKNDAEVAMLTWRFTHAETKRGAIAGVADWYWDDDGPSSDCSATPTPQVRRCIPSSFRMKKDKASLSDIEVDLPNLKATVPNYLDFHYLDFKEPGKPRLHRDALSAKGTVLTIEQLVDAEEGKDRLDLVIRWHLLRR